MKNLLSGKESDGVSMPETGTDYPWEKFFVQPATNFEKPLDFLPETRYNNYRCQRDKSGLVVQLVRTPACHAGGRRFEPVLGRHAAMAQEAEHILGKDEVTSSNLVSSSKTGGFRTALLFF